MSDVDVRTREFSADGCLRVCEPTAISQLPQRNYGVNRVAGDNRVDPSIPVLSDRLIVTMTGSTTLAIHGIQKSIDHHIAAVDAEPGEETLDSLAGFADKDPPRNRLVLRRILTQNEHARRPIQPAAMENRPPLCAKVLRGVDIVSGIVSYQILKRLRTVTRVELVRHNSLAPRFVCI